MVLDGTVLVALAALTGSLIGGCSSVAAAFVGQRIQERWRRLGAELEVREKLYGTFVEEAVPFFVDALQQSSTNPAKLMQLYSRVAHIRLTAGDQVLRAAEAVAKRLLEAYEQPPENPTTVIARYANGETKLDPLLEFTEACRQERAQLVSTYGVGTFNG